MRRRKKQDLEMFRGGIRNQGTCRAEVRQEIIMSTNSVLIL